MLLNRFLAFSFLLILFSPYANGQKVGVVLSGGGATGLAHIGFLRALEEAQIPIDYVSGTSMGAIVGGLYVAGYTPEEIGRFFADREVRLNLKGEIPMDKVYYFNRSINNAAMIEWKVDPAKSLETTLPTSLINSFAIDFQFLKALGPVNAVSLGNMDSLLLPFRCTASDVWNKRTQVFDRGHLNNVVRFSSTYPFYMNPVEWDGNLYFDGGLYDNFPVKCMIDAFHPDVVLGNNVSYNFDPPQTDNLLSQIRNMMVSVTNYDLNGYRGIIVEPDIPFSTFEFDAYTEIIDSGYRETVRRLPEIEKIIERRTDSTYWVQRRAAFKERVPAVRVKHLEVHGVSAPQSQYIYSVLFRGDSSLTLEQVEQRYFRLLNDPFIGYLYPDLKYDTRSRDHTLLLKAEPENDLIFGFGGNLSSKPINTGYVGITYNYWRQLGLQLHLNTYFGKYYSSVHSSASVRREGQIPVQMRAYFTFNRWDYFKSRATFFQESAPPFIILDDRHGGLEVSTPVGYRGKFTSDIRIFNLEAEYYLSANFTATDTADFTGFTGATFGLNYRENTLNDPQFPTRGDQVFASVRWILGGENFVPGSVSPDLEAQKPYRRWLRIGMGWEQYFEQSSRLSIGLMARGEYNSQFSFGNFRATQIFSPSFAPIPEAKTLFLSVFRDSRFVTGGITETLKLWDAFHLRASVFAFQPFREIRSNADNSTRFGPVLGNPTYLGTATAVYDSPIGPVSLSLNYIEGRENPWTVFFNLGFVIHNPQALD